MFALFNKCYSEAATKTGKYVQSILDQLWRHLGLHAVVLVTYQDEAGETKISEYVCSTFTSTLI